MSFEITTAFVQQYKDNVMLLSQQRGSRLRDTVFLRPDIVGKRFDQDRIGATTAQKRTTRHSDTPLIHTPHSRRWANMFDYEWADLIDQLDKVKVLNDPTSEYAMNAAFAMGRSIDDEIITALNGTAITGEDGSGTQALTAGQQVAAGAAGLTVTKLRTAKRILDAAEVDPMDPRYALVTAKQVENLLNTTEITSADFNTVRALVQGEVDTFMGFKFIRTERLNVDGSSNRLCLFYAKSAIALGIGKDITARIAERADKSFSTQVYYCMSIGAVRLEEAKVVEVACQES